MTTPAGLFDLTGSRALVVGGTGVLGSRFVAALAGAGAEVCAAGRSEERGNAVAQRAKNDGGTVWFARMDVSSRASIMEVADRCAAWGGIDILVNAAGVNSATPFADITDGEWNDLLQVNLGSVFKTIQAFAPQMSDRAGGASIINISSASSGPPLTRVLGYAAAKAGINNLTQYLACELAPRRIRVNAIVPGFFPAEQNRALLSRERVDAIIDHTPMRRLGVPQELDGALIWLAAERASSFVTGALIRVDGGFSAMTI